MSFFPYYWATSQSRNMSYLHLWVWVWCEGSRRQYAWPHCQSTIWSACKQHCAILYCMCLCGIISPVYYWNQGRGNHKPWEALFGNTASVLATTHPVLATSALGCSIVPSSPPPPPPHTLLVTLFFISPPQSVLYKNIYSRHEGRYLCPWQVYAATACSECAH